MNPNAKDNLKPFKKGNDPRRNLKGAPPILPELKDAIARIMSKKQGDITALDAILTALFNKAIKGDVRAAQELLDRGFGKSQQFVKVEGEVKTGFTVQITNSGNNIPESESEVEAINES